MQVVFSRAQNPCTDETCPCVKAGWLIICHKPTSGEYTFGFALGDQSWNKKQNDVQGEEDIAYHLENMKAFGYCCFVRNSELVLQSEAHDFIRLQPFSQGIAHNRTDFSKTKEKVPLSPK